MQYEYSGYLATLLDAPDPQAAGEAASVVFGPRDLAQWGLSDRPTEKEWQQVPVQCDRTDTCVKIEGRFGDIRRIDCLSSTDPSYWVALSSRNWRDRRFPADVSRFPIAEITYRCLTDNARPAWLWNYAGGEHVDQLRPCATWRTVARMVPHFGFPKAIDSITVRLFACSRATASMEIASIRLRALTPGEADAIRDAEIQLESTRETAPCPVLDEFLPFGCCLMAGTAKRMAGHLEISLRDYWRLLFEDLVRHYHNCIAIEGIEQFTPSEWRDFLAIAESFSVRVVAEYDWPLDHFEERGRELVDAYIRPYAQSSALLAYTICDEPPERTFPAHIEAKKLIREADPVHPLAAIMRNPDAYPLFAPFFSVCAISHFKSHSAWDMADLVRTHLPLSSGRRLWVVAPAFTYATDTPEWYTCPENRLMLNLALGHGARGWFAFSYHNDPFWLGGSFQRSLTGPFLTFSDIWGELGLRVERIGALSPLLLGATPVEKGNIGFRVQWEPGTRPHRPKEVDPLVRTVLAGKDYCLYYITNNDIADVTPANVEFAESGNLSLYDVTDYVRGRVWEPMPRKRHIEMFPGQGRVILSAPPEVCEQARIRIAHRMAEEDSRQIAADLGLARRYDLPIDEVQRLMQEVGSGDPLADAIRTRQARDLTLDVLYANPHVVAPRSKLIEISAAICACDGVLCRQLTQGHGDRAREWGLKVVSVARELTHLRLRLREGEGMDIRECCTDLAQRTLDLLAKIRALD